MESRTVRRIITLAAACVLIAAVAPAATGTFALLGGTPKIVSKLTVLHGTSGTFTLKVQQFPMNDSAPITKYDIDMQHLMHMVIVRDDFATFEHKHPAYEADTGTFEQDFTKAPHHQYYVYADTTPAGIGQQVFRFTLASEGPQQTSAPSLGASSYNSKAGPYNVLLQKTTLKANTPMNLDLTIVQGDDPATDLVPYLGAAAHVVMISTSTLDYVHAHPMVKSLSAKQNSGTGNSMSGMNMNGMKAMTGAQKAGPFMTLELPALPKGVYKTWVQFAAGSSLKVYTAPFTIVVK